MCIRDRCIFLSKKNSKIDAHDCLTTFNYGCPEEPYRGSTIYKCKVIENKSETFIWFFSSPVLKTQVRFSDRLSSVCLYIVHTFTFFSRTTGPISIKLGTKHPWVEGIHVSSNEERRLFLRGDNNELAKIH